MDKKQRTENREQRTESSQLTAHSSQPKNAWGQTILEFTFCFIILLLLMYGAIMAFRWSGQSLVFGRKSHDSSLVQEVEENTPFYEAGPLKQLGTDFYVLPEMNMVFNRW